MDLLRVLLLTASALPLALFMYFYVTKPIPGSRWRRRWSRVWLSTPLGPVWLAQKGAFLAIILEILAFFLFGEYALRRPLMDLTYTILIGLFWAHFTLLLRVQNSGRNQYKNERRKSDDDELH